MAIEHPTSAVSFTDTASENFIMFEESRLIRGREHPPETAGDEEPESPGSPHPLLVSNRKYREWRLTKEDLKKYSHFDAPITIEAAHQLCKSPSLVASHKFFPLIEYEKSYQPFRTRNGGKKPGKKVRLIRYAARRDSYIFSYYRHVLSALYENELEKFGLTDVVLAYRRILAPDGKGKCNIDFAKSAFDAIKRQGDCVAVALDIESFFENIPHKKIKSAWCDLLNVKILPEDHYCVFRNITDYAIVKRDDVYDRLGYRSSGKRRVKALKGAAKPGSRKIPMQLCSPKVFRELIAGQSGSYTSLIKKNPHNKGVPQGAPLSDLLANLCLLEFDYLTNQHVKSLGGDYMRYSDDILIILPISAGVPPDRIEGFVSEQLSKLCEPLVIKKSKTCVAHFKNDNGNRFISSVDDGSTKGRAGFDYLGFRFDGQKVHFRDSTTSRLHRKMRFAARATAISHVKRYRGQTPEAIKATFPLARLKAKFGRVARFESSNDQKSWTFWTYVKRVEKVFGAELKVCRGVIRYRKALQRYATEELDEAIRTFYKPKNGMRIGHS